MKKSLFAAAALLIAMSVQSKAVPVPGMNTIEITCIGIYDRQVDPIVEPGVAQSAHLHTFYGFMIIDQNLNAKALGDHAQTVSVAQHIQKIPGGGDSGLRDPGYDPQITSCNLYGDWAGYWIPSPLINGVSYSPADRNWTWSNTTQYPRAVGILRNTWAGKIGEHTYEIPYGATMVVGDPHTMSEAAMSPHVWFNCGEDLVTTKSKKPYNCEAGTPPPPIDPLPALFATYQAKADAVQAQEVNVTAARASGNIGALIETLSDLAPKVDALKVAVVALRDAAANPPAPPPPGAVTAPANEWAYKGVVIAVVEYPNCWDGQNHYPNFDVQAGIGRQHFYYADANGSCGNGVKITQLYSQYHFFDPTVNHVMTNPVNANGSMKLSFASGPYYTFHADFWNGWSIGLGGLTAGCLNKEKVYGGTPASNYTVGILQLDGNFPGQPCNTGAVVIDRCPAPSPAPYDVWFSPQGVLVCRDQD